MKILTPPPPRWIHLGCVLLAAAVLLAPSSARAANFEFAGGNAHIAALVAGPNPQITSPVPASLSASELTALCATLLTEEPLAPATIARAHRAILDGNLNYDVGGNQYDCGTRSGISGEGANPSVLLTLPAVIVFSFSPAAPAPGASVTATATYTDPFGNPRSGWTWTITNAAGTAVTDTEATGTANGNTHSTTFTMPTTGSVTVAHSMTSSNPGTAASTASRTATLAPGAPPTPTFTVTAGPAALTETDANFATTAYTITRSLVELTATTSVRWTVNHAATAGTVAADFAAVTGTVSFAAGEDTKTFTLTIIGDNINESTENFTLSVASANAAHAAGDNYPVTIADNDAIAATISGGGNVSEGGNASVTVNLGAIPTAAVSVDYAITPGTATAADYTDSGGGSITIAANTNPPIGNISIALASDGLNEGAEMFTVTIAAADISGHVGTATIAGGGMQNFTIAANDPVAATITGGGNVSEGGNATVTVNLGAIPTTAITVAYTVTAGTAIAADYTDSGGGSITIAANTDPPSGDISVAITDDNINEGAETFSVTVTAADISGQNGAASVSGGAQTFSIAASDPIALSATATAAVSEGGNATVSVALGATAGRAVTVAYTIGSTASTADVDAVAADYTDTNGGSISIASGASGGDITIALAADNLNESAETFTVAITAADISGEYGTASVASGGVQTFTIAASDDISVSIAADTTAVNEGGDAAFTVTLGGATNGSAVNITVAYSHNTISVTPTDANSGSITINAGQLSGTVTLGIPFSTTLGSMTAADTLTVSLGTITVASGGGTATAHATDNSDSVTVNYVDAAHTIAFSSPATTITEGDTATYTVTRNGPAISGSIVVSWTYTAGTVSDNDFTSVPAGGMLTFSGSDTTRTFTVATRQDTASEAGETFTLGLTATNTVLTSNGGVTLPSDITVTIGESDRPVTLSIAAPAANLTEGTAADFTVRFTESVTTTAAVTVDWTVTYGTAAAADFTAANRSGTATIAAGMSSVDVAITATADNLNEGDETFTVTLSNAAGGGAIAALRLHNTNNAADATIAASDAITVSIAADATTVNEGGDANFTVTLSSASAANITVAYTLSNIMATPTDANGGSITINAGGTMGSVRLGIPSSQSLGGTTADDTLTVSLGTITVASGGGTATAATSPNNSASVTVNYVDAAHAIAFSNATTAIVEGDTATYTVARTGPAISGSIVVRWTYTADSVDSGDFTTAPAGGELTFSGSETTRMFTIATADDAVNEGDETFTLGLTASSTALAANGGVALGGGVMVTIGASDPFAVTLSGPQTITELSTATFSVNLGAIAGMETQVAIAGAPAGDFSLSASSVTVAVGERSGTFTVTTTDGGVVGSPDRMFTLTATVTDIAPATLSVTITEDDPAARATRVEAPVVSVAQSVGQLASAAVGRRISFIGGNTVNVGGQTVAVLSDDKKESARGAWAANPFERERVNAFTVDGSGTSAKELLEQSSFALSLGGSDVNLWGSGGRVSTEGEVSGVSYDGDSTAWHFGADTVWNDGLIGIALARTDGETDFTAARISSKLKTDLTSVHPYLARNLNWRGAKVWGTFGYGVGDAELIEADTINSDLSVLSLAGGVNLSLRDNLTVSADAHWNRAELDGGSGGGKVLPKVSADALRVNLGVEFGKNLSAELRPFATLNLRQDFGDGDDGSAADVGGGLEWNTASVHLRMEAATHLTGGGAEESRLNLSLRRNATDGIAPYARWNLDSGAAGARLERGRLSVGMEVGVADNAMEFKNLLSGELRF